MAWVLAMAGRRVGWLEEDLRMVQVRETTVEVTAAVVMVVALVLVM